MKRLNMRGLLVALSLLLPLVVQPQKLAAASAPTLLTAEEFLTHPAKYGAKEGNDLGCMALAVYREAEKGPDASATEKLLVAWAIKNRFEVGFRPGNLKAAKNLCGVVWAGSPKNPQFSWATGPQAFKIESQRDFYLAFAAAKAVYEGSPEALRLRDEIGAVDLFHADYVTPPWADDVTFVGKFGTHLFYIEEKRHGAGRKRMDADLAWQVAMLEGPSR